MIAFSQIQKELRTLTAGDRDLYHVIAIVIKEVRIMALSTVLEWFDSMLPASSPFSRVFRYAEESW